MTKTEKAARHAKFASMVRHDLERRISQLDRDCKTKEEREDIQSIWSLTNAIYAKHIRKSEGLAS